MQVRWASNTDKVGQRNRKGGTMIQIRWDNDTDKVGQ